MSVYLLFFFFKIGRLLLDVKTEELYLSFHILHPFPLSPLVGKKIINTVFAALLICPMIIVHRLRNVLRIQLTYVWNHLKCRGNACHRTGCCVTLPSDHRVTILHLFYLLNLGYFYIINLLGNDSCS